MCSNFNANSNPIYYNFTAKQNNTPVNQKIDVTEKVLNACKFSDDAYCSEEQCEKTEGINRFTLAPVNNFSAGAIYFETNNDRSKIWVAFRGTSTKRDIFSDFNMFKAKCDFLDGICFHRGFLNIYMAIKTDVHDKISQIINDNKLLGTDFEIIYTGHSLGGAVATLAYAEALGEYTGNKVSLITFCAPCVASEFACNYLESKRALAGSMAMRFWRTGDVVPTGLDFKFTGYKHFGVSYEVPLKIKQKN
ncbi:hypothetical protein FACS189465_3330 [Clostridia bacterium]|nr:hypothetical protein FACS189465_3330 [Clostridia bacterium]